MQHILEVIPHVQLTEYLNLSSPRSLPRAHVPPTPDDEARQEPLRDHQRHRAGAARAGILT